MMFYSVFLINACFNIAFGTFTTNPPTNDKVCTGNSKQITWEYTTAQTVLVVEWKKDGNKIMGWDTTSNSYNYGAGFNAAKISHDNANAQVTLKNVDSSFIGIYTCEYVDGMGAQVTSGTYNLQVYDVITTPMACSCNTSEINCVLPASISQVTINGTVENLPFIPSTASTYNVCMTGDALFCLSNTIDSCEIVDLCPSGLTLPSNLTSTLAMSQSTELVSTDDWINSLSALKNFSEQTMTSSIYTRESEPFPFRSQNTFSLEISTMHALFTGGSLIISTGGSFNEINVSEKSDDNVLQSFAQYSAFIDISNTVISTYSTGIDHLRSRNGFEENASIPVTAHSTEHLSHIVTDLSSHFMDSDSVDFHSLSSITCFGSLVKNLQSQFSISQYISPSTKEITQSITELTQLTLFTNTSRFQISITPLTTPSLPHTLSHFIELITTPLHTHSIYSDIDYSLQPSVNENSKGFESLASDYLNTPSLVYSSMYHEDSSLETFSIRASKQMRANESLAYSNNLYSSQIVSHVGNVSDSFVKYPMTSIETVMISPSKQIDFTTLTSVNYSYSYNVSEAFLKNTGINFGYMISSPVGLSEMSQSVKETSLNALPFSKLLNTIFDGPLLSFSSFISSNIDNQYLLSTTPILELETSFIPHTSNSMQLPISSFPKSNIAKLTSNNIEMSSSANDIFPRQSDDYLHNPLQSLSTSLLTTSPPEDMTVASRDPSLTKYSKVIAVSVSVGGCVLFVAVAIVILFSFNILRCGSGAKHEKHNNAAFDCHSNERIRFSFFDKPYDIPLKCNSKSAIDWGSNKAYNTYTYNRNWNDIM